MRPLLESPPFDAELLAKVEALTDELYALHQHGKPKNEAIARLNDLIREPVDEGAVWGAFGSVDSEVWARFLVFDYSLIPDDLSREEMLELIQHVRGEETNEFLLDFWIECLKKNTGNSHFGDLLYWPNVYFGDEEKLHIELTPEGILETALTTKAVERVGE
ncbi:hypothetical protein [Armatimonas rosea]|uniref:Uncharacterized protein n=1 Tax=Armatimonas rosea TaxID=685828 RepID=A0A7W9SUL5_ARMRO|nr:hypothetical protein [Armatimonas rosea]MBB6053111.1 hypothetical protein [Armatimonas rosea]